MLSTRSFFTLFFVCFCLSSCAGYSINKDKPQLVAEADGISLMLAEAAESASKSLETLAAAEQHKNPAAAVSTIPNAPGELRRGMSLKWVGPADPVLRQISQRTGYTYSVIGARPATPVIISLDVYNKQIIDVLRDIGLQLGQRANLKVDAQRRIVELQYAPGATMGRR